MTDIVTRLRESATQARALDRAALLNEAADEIVKIRREVEDLRGTPPQHATQGDCSKQGEGTSEPVAWAALHDDGDIAWIGYTPDGAADGACGRKVVPLYRLPTLTDEERASMTRAIETLEGVEYMEAFRTENDATAAATLRGLMERMQ